MLAIVGCSTVQSVNPLHTAQPVRLSADDLAAYPNIESLYTETTGLAYETRYSATDKAALVQAPIHGKRYCNLVSEGQWLQTKAMPRPMLRHRPDTERSRAHRHAFDSDMALAFGEFQCSKDGQPLWGVDINHAGGSNYSPAGRVATTTVIVTPRTTEQVLARDATREVEAARVRKERQEREQFQVAVAAARAQEELKIRTQTAAAFAEPSSRGRRICKRGVFQYSYYTGYLILNQPYYEEAKQAGELVGAVEDVSEDGFRLQFRVLQSTPDGGRFKHQPAAAPIFGGLSVQPGVVLWDDILGWAFC